MPAINVWLVKHLYAVEGSIAKALHSCMLDFLSVLNLNDKQKRSQEINNSE